MKRQSARQANLDAPVPYPGKIATANNVPYPNASAHRIAVRIIANRNQLHRQHLLPEQRVCSLYADLGYSIVHSFTPWRFCLDPQQSVPMCPKHRTSPRQYWLDVRAQFVRTD
jgi:hypothetical protein